MPRWAICAPSPARSCRASGRPAPPSPNDGSPGGRPGRRDRRLARGRLCGAPVRRLRRRGHQGRAARRRSQPLLSAADRRRQRLVRLPQLRQEERHVGQGGSRRTAARRRRVDRFGRHRLRRTVASRRHRSLVVRQGRALFRLQSQRCPLPRAEYQAIEAWATGAPQKRWGFNRFTPTYPMGVYRCKQGWIVITIVTPAQWKSFCELLGMPDLGRHPQHVMGPERLAHADELEARFVPRFLDRTAGEWFAAGLELRLPFAIVPNMEEVLRWPVFRDRKAIVPIRMGDRTVEAPGSPFHLTRTPANFGGTVPELGEHNTNCHPERSEGPFLKPQRSFALRAQDDKVRADRPLAGLRIVDLSMGWAGPICTRNLADLGADVIKIEACGYPDWWRGVDNRIETVTQRLYEKSSRFNIMNRGKRAITLDLTVPDGVALAQALA